MHNFPQPPKTIQNKIKGLPWRRDDMGKSGSAILLYDEMVLKIEKITRSSENERLLLDWLNDKLPVPKIIEAEIHGGYSFLLMSKLRGEMACSDNSIKNIRQTIKALAAGMKMLWKIGVESCLCNNKLAEKLRRAKYGIENNLVDMDDFNPETFTSEGFTDVWDLYNFLDKNRPPEDMVFSHGDYCLPNIFISGCGITGFLDWGNGGAADRYQDIALCVRSFKYNYINCAGHSENDYKKYTDFLFEELGIEPDKEKIRYYILLDELF